MATYKDLQDRISLDYLNRTNLLPETKRAIKNAILTYESKRYWFNEASTAMATVSAQSYFVAPADTLTLDRLEASFSGILVKLQPFDFHTLRDMNLGQATGAPVGYAVRALNVEMFPIPDSAYTINVYYIKSLPVLSADGDSNAWTNEASNLIAHAACVDLLSGVLQADSAAISRHIAMTQRAEYELNLRNTVRQSRSIMPTQF